MRKTEIRTESCIRAIGARAIIPAFFLFLSGCGTANSNLWSAVEHNNIIAARQAVREGANINADKVGVTPLMSAAAKNYIDIANFLIDRGANINARDLSGETALMYASRAGHFEMARILIRHGEDVNARDSFGETALMFSCSHLALIKLLIDHGADVNALDDNGETALMHCAYSSPYSVNLLIIEGASVNVKDNYGMTALDIARQFGDKAGEATIKQALKHPKGFMLGSYISKREILKMIRKSMAFDYTPPKPPAPKIHSLVDRPDFSEKTPHPDDLALVIGISSYQGPLPKAYFAERDARDAARYFYALGVSPQRVKLLIGDQATLSKLRVYLDVWLKENAKPDSRFFFYFAGHGAPDPKTQDAYIVPWDGDPNYLSRTALSLSSIYRRLSRLKVKHVLVALDSCFSGAGGRSVIENGVRPLINDISDFSSPKKLTLMAASRGNQITGVIASQGHGLFTYYFLKGLDQGLFNTGLLCRYLKLKVSNKAALSNGVQNPVCRGPQFNL